MATETKYGVCVQEIPEDEPIILFRAQDKVLPLLLVVYALICQLLGSPREHIDAIWTKRSKVERWQDENADKVKVPD